MKHPDSEGSFSSKRVGARAFVVVAGAIMNLLLGFVIVLLHSLQSEFNRHNNGCKIC